MDQQSTLEQFPQLDLTGKAKRYEGHLDQQWETHTVIGQLANPKHHIRCINVRNLACGYPVRYNINP